MVGLLHFVIGPNYSGNFKVFVSGNLIDIFLPMILYLIGQITLRKQFTIKNSRIIAVPLVFLFATFVEVLQYRGIHIFGETFDPFDIMMFAFGTCLGLAIDFFIISKLENAN